MNLRPIICALLAATTFASCNIARMHTRQSNARLVREGYAAHTFTDARGPHHVWARNTGKPKLLLIHGYTGTGAQQWSKTAKLLGDAYDVIMPDLLCHGQSTKDWGNTPGGNFDAQADHLVLLLDSLGITEAMDVVGSSYGGGVAARFAELYPQRVKKLVIYDGLVSDYDRAMADSIARHAGAPDIFTMMGTTEPKEMRWRIRLSLFRDPPLPGFILRQIYEVNVKDFRAAQLTLIQDLWDHEALFAEKRYDWVMPVYLIWGERDELIPNSTGLAVMRRNGIPETHWSTIPRTAHVANLERPKAFVRELRRVLSSTP